MRQVELMALRIGDRVRGAVSQVGGVVIAKYNNAVTVRWDKGREELCGAGQIVVEPGGGGT